MKRNKKSESEKRQEQIKEQIKKQNEHTKSMASMGTSPSFFNKLSLVNTNQSKFNFDNQVAQLKGHNKK